MKKSDKVVIFGNRKMAELAAFYFSRDSGLEVVGFAVDAEYLDEPLLDGLPVVPFDTVENRFPPETHLFFVAVGYTRLNSLREEKFRQAKAKGYRLASYLSSRIVGWGDTRVGENCFVLESQVIQPNVSFGDNVFVWSGNHFGHDVTVGDHSWITSHCVLSGNVRVGRRCFLGINASIRDGVTIGDESILGAGSLILGDVAPKSVFVEKPTELYPLNSEMFTRMMDISK